MTLLQSFPKSATEALGAGDEDARLDAVKKLSTFQVPQALPLLLAAVRDESCRVREEAFQIICQLPQEETLYLLEESLRDDEHANLRNSAIESLVRFGKAATPILLRLLGDTDEEVRLFSVQMLGEIGDPDSVDLLIRSLDDSDENVQHAAAESLGKIGDARAMAPLLACMDRDFWIRYPAVAALGDIGDPAATQALVGLLGDEMLRQVAMEALGKIGDNTVLPLLADMLSHGDPSSRNDTIAALVRIHARLASGGPDDGKDPGGIERAIAGDDLVTYLLASLESEELEVRKNSIIALGWLRDKRVVARLVDFLGDYELEEYVVGSLVSIGEEALPGLMSALENPSPRIRACLLRCIGWIENGESLRSCLPFLMDPSPEVRYQAVLAVAGGAADEEVENALLALLSQDDPDLITVVVEVLAKFPSPRLAKKALCLLSGTEVRPRLGALRVLARLDDDEAFRPVMELLSDPISEVRAQAFAAVAFRCPESMPPEKLSAGLRDASSQVRRSAAACLCVCPRRREAIESLVGLAGDVNTEVRLMAIETLGKIEDVESTRALKVAFADGDKRQKVAVLRSMGSARDRGRTLFLAEILKQADPALKRAAIESLGKIHDERAFSSLIAVLEDADWSVRSAAVSALRDIGDPRSIPYLVERLRDREILIRKGSVEALVCLNAREAMGAILPLVHDGGIQGEVLRAMEKLGIPDLSEFDNLLKRSNSRLRCLLVSALSRSGIPEATAYLTRLLQEDFFTVRCEAARVLAEMGDPGAIPALVKAQREDPSEEVRHAAALALRRLAQR